MKKQLSLPTFLAWLLAILCFAAAPNCQAVTESLNTAAESNVENFALTSSAFSFVAYQDFDSSIDRRSIMEFSLATIPTDSPITSATLDLVVSSFSSIGDAHPVVPIFGYTGNGVAEVTDAHVTRNIVGETDEITQLGGISVDLDISFIQGLVDEATTHLGLLFVGSDNKAQAVFGNFAANDKPVLNITYGSAGDFNQDGIVDGLDFLVWQQGGSPDPLSQSDLMEWETNYGNSTSTAAIVGVPEPTALVLALLATATGLVGRRS